MRTLRPGNDPLRPVRRPTKATKVTEDGAPEVVIRSEETIGTPTRRSDCRPISAVARRVEPRAWTRGRIRPSGRQSVGRGSAVVSRSGGPARHGHVPGRMGGPPPVASPGSNVVRSHRPSGVASLRLDSRVRTRQRGVVRRRFRSSRGPRDGASDPLAGPEAADGASRQWGQGNLPKTDVCQGHLPIGHLPDAQFLPSCSRS